LPEA
jgi:hypothetical protein